MVAEGLAYLERRPLLALAPGAAMVVTAVTITSFVGRLEAHWDRKTLHPVGQADGDPGYPGQRRASGK
jgi:ABC-type dipeptide/oligopeptide/nickel transport system permease subunit